MDDKAYLNECNEINALTAEVKELKEANALTCTWTQDEESNWMTGCGIYWTFIDDGPEENDLVFCPKCGKRAIFEPFKYCDWEDDDDDLPAGDRSEK